MIGDLFLSRLSLRHSPEIGPLMRVLQPDDDAQAIATDHQLVWSVMPPGIQQAHEAERQSGRQSSAMLWRRESKGRYLILGPRPIEQSSLFVIESKPFDVTLAAGDRLRFVLRVNATVDRRIGGRAGETRRSDIVMDMLRADPAPEHAGRRLDLAQEAATAWLAARGGKAGFALDALAVESYRATPLGTGRRSRSSIGILDLAGILTISDAPAFLARLKAGFGRAKAFGCGLMLVRRG